MARVVFLTVGSQDPDHYRRQYDDLAAAHARGLDLGSRALHMKAASERLKVLYREYDEVLSELNGLLANPNLQDHGLKIALSNFKESAKNLSDLAKRVPPIISKL